VMLIAAGDRRPLAAVAALASVSVTHVVVGHVYYYR
jgi:hypothetical protein